MRKETPADSSPRWPVRQLAIAAAALMLAGALAACTSGAGAQPGAAGSASHTAAAASGNRSAPGVAAASASRKPDVLAAARRVKCPAVDSAISTTGSGPRAQPIPAGFRPVAVVECIRIPDIVPVDGTQLEEVRRVAVTGLGRLVAALRMPSTPRSRDLVPVCLLPVPDLPLIVLIGPDDHLVRPRVPIGACGLPIVPVQVSLNSLHWKTLSATKGVWVGPRVPENGSPVPNISPAVTALQPGAP
jgi:hypothetical protein